MELISEKNERIRIWMEELKNHIFIKLGEVLFEGFTTKERLSFQEALTRDFVPMPPKTPWGAKWEYGWFRAEVVLPPEAEGQRIYLRPGKSAFLTCGGKLYRAWTQAGKRRTLPCRAYCGSGASRLPDRGGDPGLWHME